MRERQRWFTLTEHLPLIVDLQGSGAAESYSKVSSVDLPDFIQVELDTHSAFSDQLQQQLKRILHVYQNLSSVVPNIFS